MISGETEDAMKNILDTMTGADGGIAFAKLKAFVEDFANRAMSGDKDAQQVIDVVIRFSNLINYANRDTGDPQ